MLNELAPLLGSLKANELCRKLNGRDTNQVLPTEMELALLWALSKVGHLEIEPEWFGTGRLPDAYSEALFRGRTAFVEIAALSDVSLSGEKHMRRAARLISGFANEISTKAGQHLFFRFAEEAGYENRTYFRRRRVSSNFHLDDTIRAQVVEWLNSWPPFPNLPLHIRNAHIDVTIEWRERKQGDLNYHCSMPPECYSLINNPITRVLKQKGEQLRNPADDSLRCVILADVGCTLLRRLNDWDPMKRRVSGRQIVETYLRDAARAIDVICIISPSRQLTLRGSSAIAWELTPFVKTGIQVDFGGFETLKRVLPRPRFEGYQVHSLQEQSLFHPKRKGWYLPTTLSRSPTEISVKISSRAFIDLLAGRIDYAKFMALTASDASRNLIKHHLDRGETISDLRLERCGLDSDDDAIVIEFRRDPAAATFRIPETLGQK